MARNTIERQLTNIRRGRLQFAVASREDDADIRRLLRDSPMSGAISLSFEREPDYFADTINPFESKQTIVARDSGELVCMGSCSVRSRFINGRETQVGYLGGLRLAPGHAGQVEILRAGYEFFHRLQLESPADYYFTSITSDNLRARRILERGLPGLPVYQFIGELVTLMIPAQAGRCDVPAGVPLQMSDCVERLNRFNRNYQLAPVWSAEELESLSHLGLSPGSFLQYGSAAAGMWDQFCFKQTVIRGYATALARFRPALNLWAGIAGGIRLPAIGQPIRNAYVSHVITGTNEKDFVGLLNQLRCKAGNAGVELLTLAFAANDERLRWVQRHFRARAYHSRLYGVHWPDCGQSVNGWQHLVLAPEVALL